jgi:hypothetical protein
VARQVLRPERRTVVSVIPNRESADGEREPPAGEAS